MKRQSYHRKLAKVFGCYQFQKIAIAGDNTALTIEKDIKSALLDMKKSSLLSKKNIKIYVQHELNPRDSMA